MRHKAGVWSIRISGLAILPPSARRARLITQVCLRALAAPGVAGAAVPLPLRTGSGLASPPVKKKPKPRGEVAIVFLSRKDMLSLNKKYLDHGHDTDVIAFNYTPRPDQGPQEPFGDVFISAFMARRQAKELKHDVLKEVLTLAAHGCLHLIGYDDATPQKKAAMFRLQDAVVSARGPSSRS